MSLYIQFLDLFFPLIANDWKVFWEGAMDSDETALHIAFSAYHQGYSTDKTNTIVLYARETWKMYFPILMKIVF